MKAYHKTASMLGLFSTLNSMNQYPAQKRDTSMLHTYTRKQWSKIKRKKKISAKSRKANRD